MPLYRAIGEITVDLQTPDESIANATVTRFMQSFFWNDDTKVIQDVNIILADVMELTEPKSEAAKYRGPDAPPGWFVASNGSMALVQRKDLHTKTITLFNNSGHQYEMSSDDIEAHNLILREVM